MDGVVLLSKGYDPGCTTEGKDFESLKGQFADRDTVILGVSKDSVARHRKFCDKEGFTFALVSDESGRICEDFGVWQEKKNFGKTYMGIVRSTFIIDPDLNIRAEWTKVKVAGHAQAVFDTLEELQS